MGLMVAYDPDDDNVDENARARIFTVTGTNLGPKKKSLRWEIEMVQIPDKNGDLMASLACGRLQRCTRTALA